jgi:hypothetical protein
MWPVRESGRGVGSRTKEGGNEPQFSLNLLNTPGLYLVSTGFWYEWSLAIPAAFGVDFGSRTVTLFDEGETRVSVSTWPQVILLDIDHLVGCELIEIRLVELLLRFLVCLSNPRTRSAELALRI